MRARRRATDVFTPEREPSADVRHLCVEGPGGGARPPQHDLRARGNAEIRGGGPVRATTGDADVRLSWMSGQTMVAGAPVPVVAVPPLHCGRPARGLYGCPAYRKIRVMRP